jgi:hypothetical protein
VRLLEARIRLESPAIITTRRTERGFVKPSESIPGSTLRGAIVTALLREGRISSAEEESRKPTILASPAYPLHPGGRSLPATPFMWYCEKCREAVDLTRDLKESLLTGSEPEIRLTHACGEPLRPLYGSLIATKRLERVGVRSFRATSVAISKSRGSAVKGMLFDYEAVAEGTEFWALMLAPDALEEVKEMEIFVGRGASRGFGRARVTFSPAPLQSGEGGVFIALSPLTPLGEIEWGGCRVRLKRAFGRTLRTMAGWDYVRNAPRPFVSLVQRGSVVVAEVDGECGGLLSVGLPVRLEDFLLTGVNALIPVSSYYQLLGE